MIVGGTAQRGSNTYERIQANYRMIDRYTKQKVDGMIG